MFVAKMCRIRYLGGGFGRRPSARRTIRLKKPRGFFNPSISDSKDCSVPIPAPPIMPAITWGSLPGAALATAPSRD